MVLTAAQITTFFKTPTGMAIPHDTRIQLQAEGIDNVSDLVDFD
jgi:hypothetical protein